MKRVDELWTGDQVFTPAGRWETVTRVEVPEFAYTVRVFTDRTGPDYAWVLRAALELPAVDRVRVQGTPMVRIYDSRHRVMAHVGTCDYRWARSDADEVVLVDAWPLGRGQGWQVSHRPTGADLVTVTVASKAAAVSAVKRAAKAHAKALGLRLYRPERASDRKEVA